jgi:nicotinate-nucleotide adenylyltransferase
MELDREGPSYSFDTLVELGNGTQIFFILGADAFAEIATWSRYPAVLDLAHFVVVSRPGITLDSLTARVPELTSRMTTPDRFRLSASGSQLSAQTRVILLETGTPDVSSTEIRRRVRAGESLLDLVPESVAAYINAHRLYLDVSLHGKDD